MSIIVKNPALQRAKVDGTKLEKEFIKLMNYLSMQLKDLQLEILILNTKYNNELPNVPVVVEVDSENTRLKAEKKTLEDEKNRNTS